MAAGGGGAPVSSDWMRGAREVQREVREVVRWFIRAEGGRRPRMAVAARSSAMAAMAAALCAARAAGKGRRARVRGEGGGVTGAHGRDRNG
jgi:hypothetical protein